MALKNMITKYKLKKSRISFDLMSMFFILIKIKLIIFMSTELDGLKSEVNE